ncbi:hypothetical protein TNCV_2054201 [Trichonephila clavipes]|nr:hypothetical protein TNCV_2054201 [Trichonephila clavipes]
MHAQRGRCVLSALSFDNQAPLVGTSFTFTAQCLRYTSLARYRLPDLSSIEHILDIVGRRLQPFRNVDYSAHQLETIWHEIPQAPSKNFICLCLAG